MSIIKSRCMVTLVLMAMAHAAQAQENVSVAVVRLNCPAGTTQQGDKVSKDSGVFCVKIGVKASQGQGSVRHGPYIDFWANGKKQSEGSYQDGFQTGRWIFWSPDGVKTSEIDFARSVYHGTRTEYYANGRKKRVQTWENGRREGVEIRYAEDGQKVAETEFRDGRPVKEQRFENGHLVTSK